jgi:ABC-type transporter MlaC component
MRRIFWISIILTSLAPLSFLGAQQPTAADFVRQLYLTHAWETRDSTVTQDKPLFAASPTVMRAVLDSSFVAAVMADRACQKRTDGLCNLDFDPIWASQDPAGATYEVFGTPDPAIVRVELNYPSEPQPIVITYRLRLTRAGWRITDMGTKDWVSLKKQLLSPAP